MKHINTNAVAAPDEWFIASVGENRERQRDLERYLEFAQVPFCPAIRCYKGTTEQSYLIRKDFLHTMVFCRFFADQESILILSPIIDKQGNRRAALSYNTGGPDKDSPDREELGYFRASLPEVAKQSDTWILMEGTFYTTFPTRL